jgi:alpha-beta hydrolase superfamily lysophospholipase
MINSYNLSRPPRKIIILHGLNNHARAFDNLRDELHNIGFETEQVILPCHGENRKEAQDFETAYKVFDERFSPLTNEPYFVIAFSTGAMYLQLWMQRNESHRPLAQVLLAPALYINNQKILSYLVHKLPKNFFIKSFSPKEFRRYQFMHTWEYKILIEGITEFAKNHKRYPIKTLVMIDEKDELVSAKNLEKALREENNSQVKFIKLSRPYLRRTIGQHHIIFHRDYYNADDWKELLNSILEVFES